MGNAHIIRKQKSLIKQYEDKVPQITSILTQLNNTIKFNPNNRDVRCTLSSDIICILRDLSELDKQIIQYNQQLNQSEALKVDTQLTLNRSLVKTLNLEVLPKL